MQVYLSYAQSDETIAKAIAAHLEKRGLSVWKPDSGLLPGDNFWLETGKALATSKAMVVLLSPESMRSTHVRREIEYALGHANYRHRVFPIQVRPTKDIPSTLRNLQVIDGKQSPAKLSASIATALEKVA